MSGKRVLDAIKLLQASRSVASKHFAIRAHQLDVYSKTSTIGKAIKNQTDRVVLTAQAAIALSRRFDDVPPPSDIFTPESKSKAPETQPNDEQIPSRESVKGSASTSPTPEGGDDLFYDKSIKHSSSDPVPKTELHVQQEKPRFDPLPDGTIPAHSHAAETSINSDTQTEPPRAGFTKHVLEQDNVTVELHPIASGKSTIPTPLTEPRSAADRRTAQRQSESQIPQVTADTPGEKSSLQEGHDIDSFYTRATTTSPSDSSLPRMKVPKNAPDGQGNDSHLDSQNINADVFSSPATSGKSTKTATQGEEEVSEEMVKNLFHNPRIGRMLAGKPRRSGQPAVSASDKSSTSAESRRHPLDDRPIPSPEPAPADPEIAQLSSDLAQEAESAPAAPEASPEPAQYKLLESRVPSSRLGRLWQYGGLATSMAFGAFGEGLRRVTGSGMEGGSLVLSPANIERLVAKLSRMRGAALKLGQMISFQGV